jgi:glycosyltransferase involved in cell wall biosynthesis
LQPRLLYFSPSAVGGLADYAHEQANALADAGIEVTVLTTPRFVPQGSRRYQIRPALNDVPSGSPSKIARKISWVKCLLKNFRTLRDEIEKENYKTVLFGSYSEYLAPFWAGQFRSLARTGVRFGAIVHDPVRDYIVGPRWWHRRSIADAYLFLNEAFVHEEIQLDTVRPMPLLRTTVIPHGPYHFPDPTESREEIRKKHALPDHAFVLLSFGHIRDGKNLDLVIRALPGLPSLYLVVAGKEQSSTQKPITYYQELARTMAVQDRCRWIHGHVPQNEIGNLFGASDLILLAYSKNFRSASGVLNTAGSYRKPCLASAGGGNLQSVVERYQLGWFVTPDDPNALKTGLQAALRGGINPRWDAYESENSWQRNAQLVKEKMFAPAPRF